MTLTEDFTVGITFRETPLLSIYVQASTRITDQWKIIIRDRETSGSNLEQIMKIDLYWSLEKECKVQFRLRLLGCISDKWMRNLNWKHKHEISNDNSWRLKDILLSLRQNSWNYLMKLVIDGFIYLFFVSHWYCFFFFFIFSFLRSNSFWWCGL